MAFIRIKKIKNYEYAYLVENKWKKKSSRQKVKAYLGRVLELDEKDVTFDCDVSSLSYKESVEALVAWQMRRYDIACEGSEFTYDRRGHHILNKSKKPVVIRSGEGYLCSWSIKRLLTFEGVGEEEEIAYQLARAFVEAGIFVPKEVFVLVFGKVYDVHKAMHR